MQGESVAVLSKKSSSRCSLLLHVSYLYYLVVERARQKGPKKRSTLPYSENGARTANSAELVASGRWNWASRQRELNKSQCEVNRISRQWPTEGRWSSAPHVLLIMEAAALALSSTRAMGTALCNKHRKLLWKIAVLCFFDGLAVARDL